MDVFTTNRDEPSISLLASSACPQKIKSSQRVAHINCELLGCSVTSLTGFKLQILDSTFSGNTSLHCICTSERLLTETRGKNGLGVGVTLTPITNYNFIGFKVRHHVQRRQRPN